LDFGFGALCVGLWSRALRLVRVEVVLVERTEAESTFLVIFSEDMLIVMLFR